MSAQDVHGGAAHGHDDHHHDDGPHSTVSAYIIGFFLSVVLTAIPFWLVMAKVIDDRGNKVLTTSNIEDELKKKEAALKIDTFYDLGKARRVEAVIKQMLIDKGRPFGTVKHDSKAIGTSGTQVSFVIDDGPKARVKSIEFTGNQVISAGALP